MLSIYIIGFYITMLLYGLLLENSSFRNYLEEVSIYIKKLKAFKAFKNYHEYYIILIVCYILSFTSWIGFIALIALIVDFLIWKMKK